jgi:hypothetical protein
MITHIWKMHFTVVVYVPPPSASFLEYRFLFGTFTWSTDVHTFAFLIVCQAAWRDAKRSTSVNGPVINIITVLTWAAVSIVNHVQSLLPPARVKLHHALVPVLKWNIEVKRRIKVRKSFKAIVCIHILTPWHKANLPLVWMSLWYSRLIP